MAFPIFTENQRIARLEPPDGRVRAVIDTDTYNEIDDQFALVYAMLSPEQIALEAVYAAPFFNKRSDGPADGMRKSYEEILRLMERMNRSPDHFVYRGSEAFLQDLDRPCSSDAAQDLVRRAMSDDSRPLYVLAIGAPTNIASAILLEPEIIQRIVVVWLAGEPAHWPSTREFNLCQDPLASRALLDCGVPLVRIPCHGVASHLLTTLPELERYIQGRGSIGDYLVQIFRDYRPGDEPWAKEIWDLAPVAWLVNPAWVPSEITPSPILNEDCTWSIDPSRHAIRTATYVLRNPIFKDIFEKLERMSSGFGPREIGKLFDHPFK